MKKSNKPITEKKFKKALRIYKIKLFILWASISILYAVSREKLRINIPTTKFTIALGVTLGFYYWLQKDTAKHGLFSK